MSSKDYDDKDVKKLLEGIKKLKEENRKLKSRKKYGIVWEEEKEPEQVVLECKEKVPILKDVKDKEILTDEEKPMNLLIEGDNYHALQVLNYTYKGKVDVFYIDPPYNTGNKDFMYNDRYVDKEDNYRHSKWLNFMNKRLKLSKELLKNEGIVFISIDENELYQLKLLCDEIFGENNFVTNIKLKVKAAAGVGQESFLQDICEYVLVYSKNSSLISNNRPMVEEPIRKNTTKMYNKILKDFGSDEKINSISGGRVGNIDVYEHKGFDIERITTIQRDMKKYYSNYEKIFRTTNPQGGLMKRVMPQIPKKGLVSIEYVPTKGRNAGELHRYYFIDGSLIVWLKNTAVRNEEDKSVGKLVRNSNLWIENLHQGIANEGGVKFKNGKKPIRLIKRLIDLYPSNSEGIILDFFAGSGTTGHAVLDMNKKDGGNRKFILCTNNEENNGEGRVAENVCFPRIKNVVKGLNKQKKLGGNLKYFKTDFIDVGNIYNISDEKKIELTHKAGEMIAIREDAFEEVEKNEWWQIFNSKDKTVAIYFREDQKKLSKLFEKLKKDKAIIYLFSWGKNELKASEYGYGNITIRDIPQPIIDVYKEINRL